MRLASCPCAAHLWQGTHPPLSASGGHGVGWSEIPPYSFKVGPGWDEVPTSIAVR